jgi:hypothetical protein
MDSDAFSSKFGELGKSVILLFLQGFSLVTTVEGAKIIAEDLPVIPIVNIPTYLLLGMGIQLMIFWLLVFGKKGGIKSPTILWMLIIILTFCSIYTSFFSLYKGLSGKDLNATTIAIEQSDRITTEIFNSSKYTEESKDYPSRQQEFDKEDTTWNRTCITGINIPECQNVKEKLNAANKNLKPLLRVKRLEEYTKKIKEYQENIKTYDKNKNYSEKEKRDFKSLQALAIRKDNKSIISDFHDVISEGVKRQQQSSEGYILFPLEKLLSGDKFAITAFLIAFLVDGIAILFGMDSDENNGNKFKDLLVMISRNIRNEAHSFLPRQISFFSHIITNIISSLSGAIQKLISVIFIGISKIFYPFSPTRNINTLQIEGTKQDFIYLLLDSMDETKIEGYRLIDRKQLALYSSENDSFKRGYQTLIERMIILKWIEMTNENDYKIIEYVKFHNWHVNEMNKTTDYEIHSVPYPDKFYTIVSIPKQKGFFAKTFAKIVDHFSKRMF